MSVKAWSPSEIRAIARQTVEGRKAITTARGAYLRALLETAQSELQGGKSGPLTQMAAVKAVHRRFYPLVQEAVTSDDIKHSDRLPRPERHRRALERNRRTNFARSAYGTIRRWLRAPGHDLMKLDPKTVTKSQLLEEAPPTRKHALTPERIHTKADVLIRRLLGFTKQIAKADRVQAAAILNEAMERLVKQIAATGVQATNDARVAVQEQRPLRAGGAVFWPTVAA